MADQPKDPFAPPFGPKPAEPILPATPPAAVTPPAWLVYVKWAVWVAAVVAAIGTFVLQWQQGGKAPVLPDLPPLPQQPLQPDGPPSYQMGWESDPAAVAAVAASLEFESFAETPIGQGEEPLPKSVYLWHSYRKITGKNPPPRNQNPVGSCVAHGTNRACERTMEVAVANGASFELRRFVEEVTYAGSRVDVGGGRIRGDGSVGAWAAKYVVQDGVLPEGVYGQHDLTRYDPDRCRQWGYSGAPAAVKAEAKKYPVGDATLVKGWATAKKALAAGSGIAICSDVGFNKPGTPNGYVDPAARDLNGCCQPNGTWAHCMALDGYHTDEKGREWGHIENSWGATAHAGPVGWGEPNTSGFWADAATIDRMLKQGDSWAFAAVKGFPKKKVELDWFAAVPSRRDTLVAGLPFRRGVLEAGFALAP